MSNPTFVKPTLPLPLALAKPEAVAIRAVARGEASPEMQRLAIAAIRQKICIEDQASFVAADPISTAYNEGKRSVGLGIRFAMSAPINDFPEVDHGR